MKPPLWLCIAVAATLLPAHAAPIDVRSGSARLRAELSSVRELRDFGVVKQRYDYSCGAAALATLLTYGLSDPVDEETILADLLSLISAEQENTVRQLGLSLLELQRLAERRGHKAQGFRIAGSQLAKVQRPVIVFIQPRGYRHFAVLKGVRGDRAYLADPSLGNVRMPLHKFIDMWQDESGRGVVFAVERKSGDWPEKSALDIAVPEQYIEALTARQLYEVGKPFRNDNAIR